MILAKFIIVIVLGYLLGSVPYGLLIAKWRAKVDVREYGSGKTGTTNVLRTAGHKAAILAPYLFHYDPPSSGQAQDFHPAYERNCAQ